jgi:hypothetical protein
VVVNNGSCGWPRFVGGGYYYRLIVAVVPVILMAVMTNGPLQVVKDVISGLGWRPGFEWFVLRRMPFYVAPANEKRILLYDPA